MARYDGLADWYDERIGAQTGTRTAAAVAVELLGEGHGRTLLDVGCGTGLHLAALAGSGWTVTGVDISTDQLRVAAPRASGVGASLVCADATALPFANASFDAVALLRVLTDVDDPGPALREAARVVRHDGAVVVVTAHPCFVGPSVVAEPDGSRRALPGYRAGGWHTHGPGIGDGIRGRVGTRHVTLAELLNALSSAGLVITHAEEPGEEPLPTLLAVSARRS